MDAAWRKRLEAVLQAKVDQGADYIALAKRVGLTRNYVQQFAKRRETVPSIEKFLKLCETLDVSPIWALTGYEIDAQTSEFLDLVKRLPPEDVAAALRLLKLPKP